MAHIGEECRLCSICVLCAVQRVTECQLLRHGVTRLFVDIRETHANRMDQVILAAIRMTNSRHSQKGIGLLTVMQFKESIRDGLLFHQRGPDVFRLNKCQVPFPILFCYVIVGKCGEIADKGKRRSHCRRFTVSRIIAIANRYVLIQINIVDTSVIGRERCDHFILLFLKSLLFQQQLLLFQAGLVPTAVPEEEENHQRGDGEDDAAEQAHVIPQRINKPVIIKPGGIAIGDDLGVVTAQNIDAPVDEFQQPFIADFNTKAAVISACSLMHRQPLIPTVSKDVICT